MHRTLVVCDSFNTNGCTRRHSRKRSNINHTLKHYFSRHIDEAVFKTENFLGITAENSFLIAVIGLLPKLYLASDSFTYLQFHIIEVLNDPALVDESAKPVWTMAVRKMKMIPDEVGGIGLALHVLRIGIEMVDGHGVGVQSPQRNVFLFQGAVCGLFTCVSAHKNPPTYRSDVSASGHKNKLILSADMICTSVKNK